MRACLILGAILSLAAPALAADALTWFHKGVYTTNPDEQITCYKRALKEDPTLYQAKHNLAGAYYRKGYYDEAIGLYKQLIQAGHAYYQTYYNLACCYALKGDVDHGIGALKIAVRKGFKDAGLLDSDADMSQLSDDPRFQTLQRAAGLSGASRARALASVSAPSTDDVEPEVPSRKGTRKTRKASTHRHAAKAPETSGTDSSAPAAGAPEAASSQDGAMPAPAVTKSKHSKSSSRSAPKAKSKTKKASRAKAQAAASAPAGTASPAAGSAGAPATPAASPAAAPAATAPGAAGAITGTVPQPPAGSSTQGR